MTKCFCWTPMGRQRTNGGESTMDKQDCANYAKVYRLLADILVRERPPEGQHMSFILGDLARRVALHGLQVDQLSLLGPQSPHGPLQVVADTLLRQLIGRGL